MLNGKLYKIYRSHGITFIRQLCSQSCSMSLYSDTEKLLESQEMKHRKHPGVRKRAPIKMPPALYSAIDKIITKDNVTILTRESQNFITHLQSRRLPVEKEEIRYKLGHSYSAIDQSDYVPENVKRKAMKEVEKQIKAQIGQWKPIEYNNFNGLVYLVSRLDANYASTYKVFSEIKDNDPSFKPKTFFDFGSGVGSATWAAHSLWSEDIEEYFCVDASSDMNDISANLLTDQSTGKPILKNLYFRQFLPASENIRYDLVVSAFSLLDLNCIQERIRVIDTLWRKTNDILVIIEFGNNAGFHSVLDARDYILQVENEMSESSQIYTSGAHVIGPCPHDVSCPRLKEKKISPCGFYVTYESAFPRHAHQIRKDWISYVILKKGYRNKNSISWPRIVKPVLKKDRHIHCCVCCDDGDLKQVIISKGKHGRHLYRCVRSSTLGDTLPVAIKTISEDSNLSSPLKNFEEEDYKEQNVT